MTRAKALALASLLAISTAHAGTEDRSWHLLQKQHDGLIRSVQHGLTQHECEFARARIMGLPATEEEKAEAKRMSDLRAAQAVAANQKWLAEHPTCKGDQRDWDVASPKECRSLAYGWDTRGTSQFIVSTDIASAECFQ